MKASKAIQAELRVHERKVEQLRKALAALEPKKRRKKRKKASTK